MLARQKAVQTAISHKGQRDQIADIYNKYFDAHPAERPRKYRVKYSDLLCATFVSSIFCELNWCDIVIPECGAWRMAQNMDALGRLVHDKKYVPKIGDIVFFGINNRIDGITHVGIVTEVTNDKKRIYYYDIQTVVGRHTCPVGYSYIWGYGTPDYESKDIQPAEEPKEETPEPDQIFAAGDLVTINKGAKWYSGSTIKASCFDDRWYIIQVNGDRAVLGLNYAETRNICSPINVKDISLVIPKEPEKPEIKRITVTIEILPENKELLDIMAVGNSMTYGEVIDNLLEDAR